MKTAMRALALSTAPGELSVTRFCETMINATTRSAMAGTAASASATRPSTKAANPTNRIAIEIGWPLES